MKLLPSLWVFTIAGFFAPAAVAGQPSGELEWGQKARPDPVILQVMLVQAAQTPQTKAQYDRIVGVCDTAEAGAGGLSPASELQGYFSIIEKKVITGPSSVTVLVMPKHGELYDRGTMDNSGGKLVDSGVRSYYYTANTGYFGEDQVVFMVEMGGMKVKVVYSLHVTEISDDEVEGIYCPIRYNKLPNNTGGATTSQSFQFNFAGVSEILCEVMLNTASN